MPSGYKEADAIDLKDWRIRLIDKRRTWASDFDYCRARYDIDIPGGAGAHYINKPTT